MSIAEDTQDFFQPPVTPTTVGATGVGAVGTGVSANFIGYGRLTSLYLVLVTSAAAANRFVTVKLEDPTPANIWLVQAGTAVTASQECAFSLTAGSDLSYSMASAVNIVQTMCLPDGIFVNPAWLFGISAVNLDLNDQIAFWAYTLTSN